MAWAPVPFATINDPQGGTVNLEGACTHIRDVAKVRHAVLRLVAEPAREPAREGLRASRDLLRGAWREVALLLSRRQRGRVLRGTGGSRGDR